MRRSSSACLLSSSFSTSKLSTLIFCVLIFSTLVFAAAPDRIAGPVVAQQLVKLSAGVPLKAQPQFDQGRVDPSLKLGYITLLTVPSASQQKAMDQLLAQQQDPRSPLYHKWLTPEQYADRFGLSPNDIQKLTAWLQSQGFTIVRVARARNFIVFSGTAAQAESAFQTEIHNFDVNGEKHFSNTTAPSIPAALSGVVTGIRGLSNFRPKSQARRGEPAYTFAYKGNNYFFLAPGDIAAIYDVGTLQTSLDGTGQSLAVMGQTGIYQSDLTNFRQNFGLSAISCTTTTDIITACDTSNFKYILVNGSAETIYDDPNGYDDLPEADLDLEWSGATAPKAQVIFVTATDFNGGGVWDSWYYAVDNTVAPVITMSYTSPCELFNDGHTGTGEGTFTSDEAELQAANLYGITFLNSAGDTGAAECDYGVNLAENGYAVAYPASSQYVTGVGGTSIPAINPNEYSSSFWNLSNGSGGASAKGYITEQPWNDAEEFGLLCTPSSPCTLNGVAGVDSWASAQTALGISAGGGGVSNCFTIDDNGVCTDGFPQPSWQSGISASAINPSGFGMTTSTPARYSPDVSLLASPNFPGYLICTQEAALGGTGAGSVCDSPSTGISDMLNACFAQTGPCSIFGGTSVSTPVFAGMVTLLNQYLRATGGLGNINLTLYNLAAANSTNHAFHPVITGTSGSYSNGAWCTEGTPSGVSGDPWPSALQCPSSGANAGFLGFNAYDADPTTNYNLVTGLGSVDAYKLAVAWNASRATPTVTIGASASSIVFGQSLTLTATVTSPTTAVGKVTFYVTGAPSSLGTAFLNSSGVATLSLSSANESVASLPISADNINAYYPGDANNTSADTTASPALVNVTAPNFTFVSNGPSSHTVLAGQTTQTTVPYTFLATPTTPASSPAFTSTVIFSCSFSPTDPTLTNSSCVFNPPTIAADTSSATTVSMTITTAGPNTGTGSQLRHRADNRSPWLALTLPIAGFVMLGLMRGKVSRRVSKRSAIALFCFSLALFGFMLACGGSSSKPITVAVSGPASIFPNNSGWPSQTAQFTATLTNDSSNKGVTWTASEGSIDATGLFTAPTVSGSLTSPVTIKATSVAQTDKSGTASIALSPTTLPNTYTVTVTATEGPTAVNSTPVTTMVVQ